MKRYILALALLCPPMLVPAQSAQVTQSETVTPVEGNFSKFEYQGFSMMVPASSQIDMTAKEAIVKTNDGTFGMSVKVEKDKDAKTDAAVEMCRRMATDLDVKGARVTKVMIHGLQGGKLEGTTEGAPISVLILNAGGKYLKMVVINTPDHADWVNITIDSVTPV